MEQRPPLKTSSILHTISVGTFRLIEFCFLMTLYIVFINSSFSFDALPASFYDPLIWDIDIVGVFEILPIKFYTFETSWIEPLMFC